MSSLWIPTLGDPWKLFPWMLLCGQGSSEQALLTAWIYTSWCDLTYPGCR